MAANDTVTAPSGEQVAYGYHKPDVVPKFWREKYEKEAGKYWNDFYKVHNAKFFKDRHWIDREFDELKAEALGSSESQSSTAESSSSDMVYALEVGCGVGNTVFPLLEANPKLFFYAVDFAAKAIELLKENEVYKSTGRCSGHVVDMVKDPLPAEIAPQSLDVVMMIFVLSAISPEKFDLAIAKLAAATKVGGCIMFRDYASGDMAQQRFDGKEAKSQKIQDRFYVRSDGTRAYYFEQEELVALMAKHGFEAKDVKIVDKIVENRKQESQMHRLWIQGKFVRVATEESATN